MGGNLSGKSSRSRLSLAKEAINMFVSKLRPSDSFGLVTFDNHGYVVIKGTKKSDLDMSKVFTIVDEISTKGGTTLSSGFNLGLEVLKEIMKNCKSA